MLPIYGEGLVGTVGYLARIGALIEDIGSRDDQPLKERPSKSLSTVITRLERLLKIIDAPATLAAAAEVKKHLARGAKSSVIANWLEQILSRFEAELKGKQMLLLTSDETKRLRAKEPVFGEAVEDAFPSALEDIAEASKCSALGRYTASVFHLMRAMECAVQGLSHALHIQNPEREWGKLLSDMEKKIEAMPKGDARDQWSESHAHLYHVKQAWRNKTMHPKKTYTDEEAHAVFAAVRSFMRHLAPLVTPAE